MNIRGFVALTCTTYIISMFAAYSNGIPLSAINPSLPRSFPNMEVQAFELQDTRLYPRVWPLSTRKKPQTTRTPYQKSNPETTLIQVTTFLKPHIAEWVKHLDSLYVEENLALKVIDAHFNFLRDYLSIVPINTADEGAHVRRLVNLVVVAEKWMQVSSVKAGIRTEKGDQWTRMQNYLTVLKSLGDNEELKRYQAVHSFLERSLQDAKDRLKVILPEPKPNKDSNVTHNPNGNGDQTGNGPEDRLRKIRQEPKPKPNKDSNLMHNPVVIDPLKSPILDSGISDNELNLNSVHPPLQPSKPS